MSRQWPVLLAVALLAAVAGYLIARQLGGADSTPAESSRLAAESMIGRQRPDFIHSDLQGNPVSVARYDGQVVLLNFWATWCAPCVEEMPMLSEIHENNRSRGFVVIGIALDEPGRAAAFAGELGVSYPILVGEADVVMTGRRYGNASGMLPYSVLIDTEGVIRWTYLGALEASDLVSRVDRLVASP